MVERTSGIFERSVTFRCQISRSQYRSQPNTRLRGLMEAGVSITTFPPVRGDLRAALICYRDRRKNKGDKHPIFATRLPLAPRGPRSSKSPHPLAHVLPCTPCLSPP